jgi:bacterioferritin (cytochrome b1)
MKRLVYLLIIAAAAVGGYFLYRKMTENPQANTSGSGGQSGQSGQSGQANLYSSIGASGGLQSGGSPVQQPSLRPCSFGERQTAEFLQKQLNDNRGMVAYYENQIRLIQEMPLCNTGRSNVLGCVSSEAERQRMIESTQRQKAYFEDLASKNEATLNRLKSQCQL